MPPLENGQPGASPGVGESRQLVLWLPEFFDPMDDSNAATVLNSAFFQFEQDHPGLSIDVQIKAGFGPAGLFNYLRTAQRVAPTTLPDIVLIHSNQLWQIVDLGIVPALTTEETPLYEDYYAFSLDAVDYRDQLFGLPYLADVVHAVSVEAALPVLPAAWDTLLAAEEVLYIFPAGGTEGLGHGSALLHYLAAGGVLSEEGAPTTDTDALETFFEFLVLGTQTGVIPPLVLEHSTYESLWASFTSGGGNLALMSAQEYLREGGPNFVTGPVPTAAGQPVSLGHVWAFVILTREESQRALAFELIEHLLAPEVHAPWSQAALHLPTRPEALEQWSGQSAYATFLDQQMQVARAIPPGRLFADFVRRLHTAQAGLLRGDITVEEAIQEAQTVE